MAEQQTVSQQFADMGQRSIETMMGMQKGYLNALQQINQQWISGVNAETALTSELLTKLASAKSIPDAAIACQSCANRQFEIFAENGRQFMAASEKIMANLFDSRRSGAGT